MNQRDLELLSAYLDGELSPSDSARLESRLQSEPRLVSVLSDLRGTRSLIRKLPQRRAPRNFTLTRKMVGLNPPLPRSYPAFRFATVVATLLFFFTFGFNVLAPQLTQVPFGQGGGGQELFQVGPAATEAPAMAESFATGAPATEAPAAPSSDLAPQPTLVPPAEDEAARTGVDAGKALIESEAQAGSIELPPPPMISRVWQIMFALVALAGTLLMLLMRRSSADRWK